MIEYWLGLNRIGNHETALDKLIKDEVSFQIWKDGKAVAVVVPIDEYEELQDAYANLVDEP